MILPSDETKKRRLTERAEMTVAIEFLMQHGFDEDEIGLQLSRFYYVDIDALNEVLGGMVVNSARQSLQQLA